MVVLTSSRSLSTLSVYLRSRGFSMITIDQLNGQKYIVCTGHGEKWIGFESTVIGDVATLAMILRPHVNGLQSADVQIDSTWWKDVPRLLGPTGGEREMLHMLENTLRSSCSHQGGMYIL